MQVSLTTGLVVNVFCIFILLSMHISSIVSRDQRLVQRYFSYLLMTGYIMFGIDALWSLTVGQLISAPRFVCLAVNAIYFSATGFFTSLWWAFSDIYLKKPGWDMPPRKCVRWIPAAGMTVLSVLSIKTGWIFALDENLNYLRGPLYPVHLLLTYAPAVAISLRCLYTAVRTSSSEERDDNRILSIFTLPALFLMPLQIWLPGAPALCMGITLGIIIMQINAQNRLILLDPLTRMNNRFLLQKHLERVFSAEHRGEEQVFIAVMDVDNFKEINDRFGHAEGDRALQLTADVLKECCCDPDCFIARYGGDEFVLVCRTRSRERAWQICDRADTAIRELNTEKAYCISVSIGLAGTDKDGTTAEEVFKAADASLYRHKDGKSASLRFRDIA